VHYEIATCYVRAKGILKSTNIFKKGQFPSLLNVIRGPITFKPHCQENAIFTIITTHIIICFKLKQLNFCLLPYKYLNTVLVHCKKS
jgi:hypothetical protein